MNRKEIVGIIYGPGEGGQRRRWTQDSPILLEVWVAFAENPKRPRRELLLTPHNKSSAAELYGHLRTILEQRPAWKKAHSEHGADKPFLIYNDSVVLANLTLEELIEDALPLSEWWRERAAKGADSSPGDRAQVDQLVKLLDGIRPRQSPSGKGNWRSFFANRKLPKAMANRRRGLLWSVNFNRSVEKAVWLSRETVKADAAQLLFKIDCSNLRWAVLDCGIDATHPAFWKQGADKKRKSRSPEDGDDQFDHASRVRRTYDFTRLKQLLVNAQNSGAPPKGASFFDALSKEKRTELQDDLRQSMRRARPTDWSMLEPFLRVPHVPGKYLPPTENHGTHVAGILAADWPDAAQAGLEHPMRGLCPDIQLYDFRVVGEGGGDVFTIMAALQFIRYLNSNKDLMMVHGVNLSLSVPHEVASFACGRTPLCEECERVVASGVVVVAAAGNRGYSREETGDFAGFECYHPASITDPGNADSVITVGATHRSMPHSYGVSYFSSRGPTGDGRSKPDLVAPGEKIVGPVPSENGGSYEEMDGTSQAAPHVSGAAALLLARHRELVGEPLRVKEILCRTATDLGRERYFQGHGLVDVLRAIESV